MCILVLISQITISWKYFHAPKKSGLSGTHLYQSMERFYGAQPGEDPDKTHCIVLAPTGMASYDVQGNTLHSGLHIDLNKAKPTPLGNSEKNTLQSKYFETKAVFYDEMSMVGRELFNESIYRLREIFGTGKERLLETYM